MRRSTEQKNIGAALLKVQTAVQAIQKNATNPHFRSDYVNLEGVIDGTRDVLIANGLALTQGGGTSLDGKSVLVTYLLHVPSGEWIESELPILTDKPTAQGQGSALSYLRRYSQLAILNLAQTDDDGEAASKPAAEKPKLVVNAKPEPFKAKSRPATPAPAPKAPAMPFAHPGDYVISFGKHNGKKLADMKVTELRDYVTWILNKAAEEGREIQGQVAEFIDAAEAYLAEDAP